MSKKTTFQDELSEKPWKYNFLHLCRWIDASLAPSPGIGEDYPGREVCRLGQTPSSVFATREIADMTYKRGRLHINLFGLGLYGPNGPLPLNLTEEIHDRLYHQRDSASTDFLNMFHHRWLSLFYRAWAQAQACASLDRPERERFSFYIACLSGCEHAPEHPDISPLPSHARLAAASHLLMRSRHPEGLAAALAHFWNLPFRIEEHFFHWLTLEPEDHSRLGARHPRLLLGKNAVLGAQVPDRQSMFVVHLGPLLLDDYVRFLPNGADLPKLIAWIRSFVGIDLRWALHLTLIPEQVPSSRLGGFGQMGRSTWLSRRSPHVPVQGKWFIPEEIRS